MGTLIYWKPWSKPPDISTFFAGQRCHQRALALVSLKASLSPVGTGDFGGALGIFWTHQHTYKTILFTLPKTKIAPENRPSQKETSIPTIHFQVRAVSFREGKHWG